MQEFDVKQFQSSVDVVLCVGEKCEYEVTKCAMDSYKKYPYYKDHWEENVASKNLDYELKLKNSKDIPGDTLTADILTSIKGPVNSIMCATGNPRFDGTGSCIKNFFVKGFNEGIEDVIPAIKAFSIVYYWYGNMIPVIQNPFLGGKGKSDDVFQKLKLIKDYFFNIEEYKEKIEVAKKRWKDNNKSFRSVHYSYSWPFWISKKADEKKKAEENWKNFISGNFLQDFVNEEGCLKEHGKEYARDWFVKNTKYIIQRSYRINYSKQKFGKEDEDKIKKIFEFVFNEAGLEEYDLELI